MRQLSEQHQQRPTTPHLYTFNSVHFFSVNLNLLYGVVDVY